MPRIALQVHLLALLLLVSIISMTAVPSMEIDEPKNHGSYVIKNGNIEVSFPEEKMNPDPSNTIRKRRSMTIDLGYHYETIEVEGIVLNKMVINGGCTCAGGNGEEVPYFSIPIETDGPIEDIKVNLLEPISVNADVVPYMVSAPAGFEEAYPHPSWRIDSEPSQRSEWEIVKISTSFASGEKKHHYSLRLYPLKFISYERALFYQSAHIEYEWARPMKTSEEPLNEGKPTGSVKYIIITHEDLVEAVEPLAIWKSQKGLFTEVISTEDISEMYPTGDIQTKMRRYVRSMETLHDIDYLLLVGDYNKVPTRNTRNIWPESSYGEPSTFATDNYFGCVDPGTSWDTDNDKNYAEGDEIDDPLPDMAVGRLALNDEETISNLIRDLIERERNYSYKDPARTAVFIAGDPSNVPGYPPTTLDHFWTTYVDDVLDGRETMYYDGSGTLTFSSSSFIEHVGKEHQAISYFSHGTQTSLPNLFSTSQISSLHDTGPDGCMFVMACLTGWFDDPDQGNMGSFTDCFGEAMTETPDKGLVGYMGSSRLAFGGIDTSYDADAPGLEEDYWRSIRKAITGDITPTVGDVWRSSVTHFSQSFHPFPKSYYEYSGQRTFLEYNLLGEPEAPLYLKTPEQLFLEFDIAPDNRSVKAKVTNSTGEPVENATVSLFRYKELGVRNLTNSTGTVNLTIPPSNGGLVNITAYRPGDLPVNSTLELPDELDPSPKYSIEPGSPDGLNDYYSTSPLIRLYGDEPVGVQYKWDQEEYVTTDEDIEFLGREGNHTITFRVVDGVGHWSEWSSFDISVDSVAPVLEPISVPVIEDGENGWFVTRPTISLDSSEPIIEAHYRTNPGDLESYYSGPFQLNNGVFNVSFRAIDRAGNENSTFREFKVDIGGPYSTIQISHEPDGENGYYITAPTVVLDGHDENGAHVEYSWDEGGNWTRYTTPLNPKKGTSKLLFRAVDTAGNKEVPNFEWFRLDPDPPVVRLNLTPEEPDGSNGYYLSEPQVKLDLFGPEISPVHSVYVLVETGKGFEWGNDSVPFTGPIYIPEGKWTLNVLTVDEAGNRIFVPARSFKVDLTPPELIWNLSPSQPDGENGWYVTSPMLVLDGITHSRLEYWIDNGTISEPTGSNITLPEGVHTIHFKAYDIAGNSGRTNNFTYRSDLTSPRARISLERPQCYVNELVNIIASNSSDENGPLLYRYHCSDGRSTLWTNSSMWNFSFNGTGNWSIYLETKDRSGRTNRSWSEVIRVVSKPEKEEPTKDPEPIQPTDPEPDVNKTWNDEGLDENDLIKAGVVISLIILLAILVVLLVRKSSIKEVDWEENTEDEYTDEELDEIDIDDEPTEENDVLIFE